MQIISGSEIAKSLKNSLDKNSKKSLALVLIGSDPSSELYIKMKKSVAEKLGINVLLCTPPENIPPEELKETIFKLGSLTDSIMVQLPLPESLKDHTQDILNSIPPEKDVDSLNESSDFTSPLIQAIAESIRFTESYENKSVVILARSDEFAQNMQDYLSESLSLNNISIKKEFKEDISDFDIIISLIGIPGLITKDHIKQDAICIDVGITMVKGKPRGDFHSNINEKASFKTPVPKGVGPMTIAYLMKNILS